MTYPEAGAVDAKPEVAPDADKAEVPPPMTGDGSRLLIPGAVSLIGSGVDSCTNQDPAPGDRWCAFTKPSSRLGFDELWVINVTKASAGTTIKCDTTDANCLRLTSGLFVDPDAGFALHGFDGDTLIYYAELGETAIDSFVGPIWAWRPGWTSGHKLTSDTGVVCNGHKKSAAALCFEGRDDSVPGQLSFELHAGMLSANDKNPLPKVDSLLIAAQGDADGVRKFQADLSDDGAWVAWSTRPDAAKPETLFVQKLGDDASRVKVAEDVTRFTISPDLKKWYWIKKFNYDVNGSESGTLEVADFPAGGTVTKLSDGVADYSTAGDKGVLVRTGQKQFVADLKLIADRDTPATVKMFDKGVLGVIGQSSDGQKAVYVKDFTIDQLVDLYVASSTASLPCTLASEPIAVPVGEFVTAGGLMAWARFNELTNEVEGLYTTIGDCRSRKFATNIVSWQPASDEGFVYLEEFALDGSDEATLRAAKVLNQVLQTPGTLIQTKAASVYTPLTPTLPAVIYSVAAARSAINGLYINTKLPFTTKPVVPPPAPDGGTDGAATDAGGSEGGAVDGAAGETATSDAGAEVAPGGDAAVDAGATDAGATDAPASDAAADLAQND